MKRDFNTLKIIALVAIMGLLMTACGGDKDDGGIKVPGLGDLPGFTDGATIATTEANALAILQDVVDSGVLLSFYYEAEYVIDQNINNPDGTYNFSNKSLPGGAVSVNASASYNSSSSGGLKTLYDLYEQVWVQLENFLNENIYPLYEDYDGNYDTIEALMDQYYNLQDQLFGELFEEAVDINFNSGSTYNYVFSSNSFATAIAELEENSVTLAKGSTYAEQDSYSLNERVSTPGTIDTFKISGDRSEKSRTVAAFTATSPNGSVKVIYDATWEESESATNVEFFDVWPDSEIKYTGSLSVYGEDPTPLYDLPIVDETTYLTALSKIGFYYGYNTIPVSPNSLPFGEDSSTNAAPAKKQLPALFKAKSLFKK